MKILSIVSKGNYNSITLPKGRITNSFYDHGCLLGDNSLAGYDTINDHKFMNTFDVVFVELTYDILKNIVNYKQKNKGGPKIICSTPALNRWLRVVKPGELSMIVKGLNMIDGIGTMNNDTISMYRGLALNQNIFHMPTPILPSFFPFSEHKDKNLITLSMHTDLHSILHAKRIDMPTFLIWNEIKKKFPKLKGITWCNSRESITPNVSVNEFRNNVKQTLSDIGVKDVDVRHTDNTFHKITSKTGIIIHVNLFNAQSRISQYGAVTGIPVISQDLNETHRFLWPKLSLPWYRVDKGIEMFIKLYTDNNFYKKCIDHAKLKYQYYLPEMCKKRLMENLK